MYNFDVCRWPNKQKNGSVKRADSEIQLEGLLLETDAPVSSQESNISLNSSWSSISSKCQEAPPVYFHPDELRYTYCLIVFNIVLLKTIVYYVSTNRM